MNVSAINFNRTNFKGYNQEVIEPEIIDIDYTEDSFSTENHKETTPTNISKPKVTSPISHFLWTSAIATGTFIATKKGAFTALKGLEGKFPLFNSIDKLGMAWHKTLGKLKKRFPKVEVQDMKGFFKAIPNKLVAWADKVGQEGVDAAEKEAFKKAHKKVAQSAVHAKNFVKKSIATLLGTGAAALTIDARTEDKDGNGVADVSENKVRKTLSTAKEICELLPKAAAVAGITA